MIARTSLRLSAALLRLSKVILRARNRRERRPSSRLR